MAPLLLVVTAGAGVGTGASVLCFGTVLLMAPTVSMASAFSWLIVLGHPLICVAVFCFQFSTFLVDRGMEVALCRGAKKALKVVIRWRLLVGV